MPVPSDPASFAAGVPDLPWTTLALVVSALAALTAVVLYVRQRGVHSLLRRRLRAANRQLDAMKGRDALTGLLNRTEFETTLEQLALECDRREAAADAPREGQAAAPAASAPTTPPTPTTLTLTLIYVGLDNFRTINDGYGHRVGDGVLAEAARRLADVVGRRPLACRVGGDEFALLVPGEGAGGPTAVAEQVLAEMKRPFGVEGLQLSLTASAGIAVYPDHGSRPRLVSHAAVAMRSVKMGGGDGYTHYHPSMGVDLREQAELLQDLRHAIEGRQLQLVYQPKIDAKSLQITAAEALLRWQHPRRGWVSPDVFIRLAERHGLIHPIGRWVIDEACRQAGAWRDAGLRMRIAVNISGAQLRDDRLVAHIEAALKRHKIQPGRLTCEITESVAMEDTLQTRAAFERLRKAGLHVSIDDFGTGHSSLAILRRLPAAELKIDRAFVTDLTTSDNARSIAQAVVQMAHTLGLRVVAEGVETEGQRDVLVQMGCDELQGYLFAKPMGAAALALWALDDHKGARGPLEFRPSLFEMTQPAPLER